MRRIRYTEDVNNQVTGTDYMNVFYMRIQPTTIEIDNGISRTNGGNQSSYKYTGQKIFFNPYVDILATDKIEHDSKIYEIKSYYKARDKNDAFHHLEVVI